VAALLVIHRAFIEGDLEVPRHLDRRVHDLYFNQKHEDFASRTMWSLFNAFTSAFKELEPIPQYRATIKLVGFLSVNSPKRTSLRSPTCGVTWPATRATWTRRTGRKTRCLSLTDSACSRRTPFKTARGS
jgi:hypothetical protein